MCVGRVRRGYGAPGSVVQGVRQAETSRGSEWLAFRALVFAQAEPGVGACKWRVHSSHVVARASPQLTGRCLPIAHAMGEAIRDAYGEQIANANNPMVQKEILSPPVLVARVGDAQRVGGSVDGVVQAGGGEDGI